MSRRGRVKHTTSNKSYGDEKAFRGGIRIKKRSKKAFHKQVKREKALEKLYSLTTLQKKIQREKLR